MTAEAVAQDLCCPTCGKGPFQDRRALGGHKVAHETAECRLCGKTVNRRGLGPHQAACGRPRQHAPTGGGCREELKHVKRLLGRLTPPDALARVRRLLEQAETFPRDGYVVVGDDWGPFLTRGYQLGEVVAAAEQPVVVLHLERAARALEIERAQADARSRGWDRG